MIGEETITLEIRAKAASGKSTIGQAVADYLKTIGFQVELNDQHDHPNGLDDLPKRLQSLAKNRKVKINFIRA